MSAKPERIRWVRYAADCAERSMRFLSWNDRLLAEGAISTARAWADNASLFPAAIVHLARDVAFRHADEMSGCRASMISAAYAASAASAASDEDSTVMEISALAIYAAEFSIEAIEECAESDVVRECLWQAERRRYYGLQEARP